jgi:hypothetical protein
MLDCGFTITARSAGEIGGATLLKRLSGYAATFDVGLEMS